VKWTARLMRFAPLTASYAITDFIATSKRVTYRFKNTMEYLTQILAHDRKSWCGSYLTTPNDFCGMLLQHPPRGEGRGEGDPITAELAKLLNQNEMLCNIFVAIRFYYARKRVLCSAIALVFRPFSIPSCIPCTLDSEHQSHLIRVGDQPLGRLIYIALGFHASL
jgi:hypothetical protein